MVNAELYEKMSPSHFRGTQHTGPGPQVWCSTSEHLSPVPLSLHYILSHLSLVSSRDSGPAAFLGFLLLSF